MSLNFEFYNCQKMNLVVVNLTHMYNEFLVNYYFYYYHNFIQPSSDDGA